jgi:hypothetical protein
MYMHNARVGANSDQQRNDVLSLRPRLEVKESIQFAGCDRLA